MPGVNNPSVAVAVVTYDRPTDLKALLSSLARQDTRPQSVSVVDAGTTPASEVLDEAREEFSGRGIRLDPVRSQANLGGAGGFSLAILHALATGAQWVWIMDDDAHPEESQCLSTLIREASKRELDVVLPIVASPEDADRLSFGFRLDRHIEFDRNIIAGQDFLPNIGHFFNGALIKAEVFYRVGLPDLRLFIRGDETDFMLRLRAAKIPFGTVTSTALRHPTGWSEVRHVFGPRWHVLVPDSEFKRGHFYRNRGYLIRRHRRIKSFVADAVGYPAYFLRHRDFQGLRSWAIPFVKGLRNRGFSAPEPRDHS